MTEFQDRILAELKTAAEKRQGTPVRICAGLSGVTVRQITGGADAGGEILEEYIWNSARNMLVRVCYVVWEHIVGEDHA